jgi:hypothetical protein
MNHTHRVALKKRFNSPAALAAFGAFAVPEPLGAIMVVCAAIWWCWSRKRLPLRRGLKWHSNGRQANSQMSPRTAEPTKLANPPPACCVSRQST